MELQDALESAKSEDDTSKSRLNAVVAVTVALVATLMAICNVKDGNIVQAMQQAQANQIDHWSWYQAKKQRVALAESTLSQLRAFPDSDKTRTELTKWENYKKKEETESKDVQKQAQTDGKAYDDWNYRDDQFDASESALSLAIALLAVTSLTQKRWLFLLALIPAVFGSIMGLAGLFGWHVHPDAVAKWLGT